MENILRHLDLASVPAASIDDWTAEVKRRFGPYVHRKRILTKDRQSLRTELINLAEIEVSPKSPEMLRLVLRAYRAAMRSDKNAAIEFLAERFEDIVHADENWMALFMLQDGTAQEPRLYDYAFRSFTGLESMLEGCYKLHLRVLYGFAAFGKTGHFPSDAATTDFGALCPQIRAAIPHASSLLEDPLYAIGVNQWRNIAAHKSFTVVSDELLEAHYGRNTVRSFQLPSASLHEILRWAKHCLLVVRMANVITYLEYMKEIQSVGIPNVAIRLESFLTSLCHNLQMAGFECIGTAEEDDVFVLLVGDHTGRNFAGAIIHVSQVLDQISIALEHDPTTAKRFKRSMVRLIGDNREHVASASINIEDAAEWTLGRISTAERLKRTLFEFADKAALPNALAELRKRG